MSRNLNLKHLYYFWAIAREGSIARAAEALNLAPQTLSGQLATFETALGGLLFHRSGRSMVLSDLGRSIWPYADDMFAIAGELEEVISGNRSDRPIHLAVGITASIHKLFAYHMIEPALQLSQEVQLKCRTGTLDYLMQDLKQQKLDVVLTDRLPAPDADFRIRQYTLEESTISLFAAPEVAAALREGFPNSLDGQAFLSNAPESPYFNTLLQWLEDQNIHVNIRAEVDDSALIKVFARQGLGIFSAPTVITDEVCRQYNVERIGQIDEVNERLHAITRANRTLNPAIQAICQPHTRDGDTIPAQR
ncbi:LysR family transcriptional regulator [Marinobacteraceae bacterium S3BR75-40.1]